MAKPLVQQKRVMVDLRCEVCGEEACFGLEWPLSPMPRWFCPKHKPADYYGARDASKAA